MEPLQLTAQYTGRRWLLSSSGSFWRSPGTSRLTSLSSSLRYAPWESGPFSQQSLRILSPVSCKSPDHHHFKGHPCYIFFSLLHLIPILTLSCSLYLFPFQCVIYAPMPNWVILLIKKNATVTFSSYSNISLGVSFVAKQSFGPLLVCSAGLLSVQQWDNYIAQSSHCVLFCPFSSRLCAFISMYYCSAIVTALSPGYRWVKTYSCTLSGQLIMDFDYSHFVLLSAAPSPTGGPAERPAPLIVSVSGLIEPNGNGCCQSSLFSSVYMLIHQRDIHYRLAENSSRHAHTHTHTHAYTHIL